MYINKYFKTKKALKAAIKAGERIELVPGLGTQNEDGTFFVEGPHWTEPHKWYARVIVKEGIVTSVK